MKEITRCSKQDQVLKQVIQYTKEGWPNSKSNLTDESKMYFDYRDEFIKHRWITSFQRREICHPKTVDRRYKKKFHVSHQAATTSINKALLLIFWLGMNSEIRNFIGKCDVRHAFMNKQ